MITRRQAAQYLDIPVEMAQRNGIPSRLTDTELAELDQHPPAWLAQSRANRTGKRPVWVNLRCYVCDFSETVRPKKWWPDFDYVVCAHHGFSELPDPAPGHTRREYDGVGDRFIGIVEESGPR
ncbi:MAG: hypothetical protein ACHP7K_10150 [Actinomycetales bacterium]|jgi:hypothetical protein